MLVEVAAVPCGLGHMITSSGMCVLCLPWCKSPASVLLIRVFIKTDSVGVCACVVCMAAEWLKRLNMLDES